MMVELGQLAAGVTPSQERLSEVLAFYSEEALLLDEQRFEEWYALLTADLIYEMPVRSVMKGGKEEYETGGYRISDRLPHVRTRIDRLSTGHAWAEEPPSRVVRSVGSVLISGASGRGGMLVDSAVVLYRNRGQNDQADIIAYRRKDELLVEGGRLKLARRRVLAPDNIFKLSGVTVFL